MASGRHDAVVLAAAFSADGRTAVTGGEDSRVIVWDVRRAAAERDARRATAGSRQQPRDQPRRPHPLRRRARRQGPGLGPGRRPPPRSPVRHRARPSGRLVVGDARQPRAEPRRPRARRRAAGRERGADRRAHAARAIAASPPSRTARSPAWRTCRAAGCSRSAATSGFLAVVDLRSARGRQAAARPHARRAHAELQRRRAADGDGVRGHGDGVGAAVRPPGRPAPAAILEPAGHRRRRAEPRRADAGGRVESWASRSSTSPTLRLRDDAGAARAGVERPLHAGRPPPRCRTVRGVDAAGVHGHVAAGRRPARRAYRRGDVAVR